MKMIHSLAQGAAMFIIGIYVKVDPPIVGAKIPPVRLMSPKQYLFQFSNKWLLSSSVT